MTQKKKQPSSNISKRAASDRANVDMTIFPNGVKLCVLMYLSVPVIFRVNKILRSVKKYIVEMRSLSL